MTDQPTDKGGVRWAVGDVLQHPCGSQWELIEHLGGKHDDWRGRCIVGHPRPGYGSGENIGRERTFHREYMDRTFSKTLWPQPKEETGWEWPEEIDVMGNDSDAPPTSFGVWAPAGVHDLSKWETRRYVPKQELDEISDSLQAESDANFEYGEREEARAEAAEQKLGEVEAAAAELVADLARRGASADQVRLGGGDTSRLRGKVQAYSHAAELAAQILLAALQTSKPDPTQKGDE